MRYWRKIGMGLAAALLCAALPAAAQLPNNLSPAAATKVAELEAKEMTADLADKAAISEQILKVIGADTGEESREYLEKLMVHSTNLSFARRTPEARQVMLKAVAIAKKLYGPDSYTAADYERSYAITLRMNGYDAQAIEPYSHYVRALTEEAWGCGKRVPGMIRGCARDEVSLGETLVDYGRMLKDVGRGDEGIAAFDTALARFEPRWAACETEQWGTKCVDAREKRREMRGSYAQLLAINGRLDASFALRREILDEALAAIDACTGDDCEGPDFRLAGHYRALRATLNELGRTDDMLALDERMIPVFTGSAHYKRGKAGSTEYFDKDMVEDTAAIAEAYAKAALASGKGDRARKFLGPYGYDGFVGAQQATVDFDAQYEEIKAERSKLDSFGDEEERIANSRKKLALFESRYGKQSDEYAEALRDLAWDLDDIPANDAEAEAKFREALGINRGLYPADNFRPLYALGNLADFLTRRGRNDEAAKALSDVLSDPAADHRALYTDPDRRSTRRGLLGDPDDQLNKMNGELAALLLRSGRDPARALTAASHATLGMVSYRDALGFDRFDEMNLEWALSDPWAFLGQRRYADYFVLEADALWAAGQHDGVAAERAFMALQEAMAGTASRAVAKAAADRAAERASVTPLIEERRRIDDEIKALETRSQTLPVGPDRQAQASALQSEIARKSDRRAQIDAEVAAATPDYFALIRPKALTAAQAQALLAPDEAFVMLVPSEFGTHAILVTRDKLVWRRADMKAPELAQHVRRLLWDAGANVGATDEEKEKWMAEGQGDFPFDRGTAFLLYDKLLSPFAADLKGKRHLFTAATGSLSSLPLGILVTEKPVGADGDPKVLRATKWLADGPALLQLPSLQSLQLLRAVAARGETKTGERMIGFGDPVLDGKPSPRGAGGRGGGTRGGELAMSEGLQPNYGGTAPLADPALLRKLARLPGTETELKAMQGLLGTANARLYLADQATEKNMKHGNLTGLSVLFLATHGLVAGELKGVSEPGLVFTPPATASADDDGLLTASEVAALRLGARWVILSACNTAAGDGAEGAPGLSGLARAFFFAGSESLLASHWPVRDDVAAVLTVRIFELMKADPKLSRAEALQRAEQEIRNDPRKDDYLQSWSHPSAWAPFSLIGDSVR